MTTEELFEIRQQLISQYDDSSEQLAAFVKPHKGNMGLVSDECRATDEYKRLKTAFEVNKHKLRKFNQATNKNKELKQMIKDDIMRRRMAKLNA